MNSSSIFIRNNNQNKALLFLTIILAGFCTGCLLASGQWFFVLLLFFFLVWATYRSPLFGLGLVLCVSLLASTFRLPLLGWNIDPVYISSMDILTILLTVSVGLRWMMKKVWVDLRSPTVRLFIVFVLWVLLNILRGFFTYAESAIGEARPYIYFVVITIYVATYPFKPSQLLRIIRLWVLVGMVLTGTLLLRWLGLLPIIIRGVMEPAILESGWLQYRSIDATETLFLLLIFFGLTILWIDRTPRQGIQSMLVKGGALFLFLLVLVMRHRSVWLAALTGCAVLLFYFRLKVSRLVWTGLFIFLVIFTTLYLWQPSVLTSVNATLFDSISVAWDFHGSTASWRLEGWIYLLRQMSLQDYLIGSGYGAYFLRYTSSGAVDWNISPHSFYVRTLMRLGFVGLIIFFAFVISLLRRLASLLGKRTDELRRNLATILFVGIIAFHAYIVAYFPPAYFGIFLGIAMWMTRSYSEKE
jgi:hypothetical protein